MNRLVIGTRGSPLALRQSESIAGRLKARWPGLEVSIEVIKTTGDRLSERPPPERLPAPPAGHKGLFIKEIEEALLEGRVDAAVHSLKDVPTELPDGLCLQAIPLREDARDALVMGRRIASLEELGPGIRLGTSSPRRQLQLRELLPEAETVPVRGNVDSRIRKMTERGLDGLVLARAGLRRLGLEGEVSYVFSPQELIPAPGQGALALESRQGDERVQKLVGVLDHPPTRRFVEAERLFLRLLGGGCQVPMGAHAFAEGEEAVFLGFVADPAGGRTHRPSRRGGMEELEAMASESAAEVQAYRVRTRR